MSFKFPQGSVFGVAGSNNEFTPPMCRLCARQDGEDGADLTLVAGAAGEVYECDTDTGCRDPMNRLRDEGTEEP